MDGQHHVPWRKYLCQLHLRKVRKETEYMQDSRGIKWVARLRVRIGQSNNILFDRRIYTRFWVPWLQLMAQNTSSKPRRAVLLLDGWLISYRVCPNKKRPPVFPMRKSGVLSSSDKN